MTDWFARNDRKDWKAFQWDYDAVTALSETFALYCLSSQQVAVLLAAIDPIAWPTRWYSDTGQVIDTDFIESIKDNLGWRLMLPCDDCGGDTLTKFKGAVQENAARIQRNREVYDGTPQSINPYAPQYKWGSGAFGTEKDHVLCPAACEYVRATVWNYYMLLVTLTVTAAAITVLVAPLGVLFWVLGAAAVIVAGIGQERVEAALNDEAALDSIGCQFAGLLSPYDATFTNFQIALAALTAATDTEQTIVSILQATLAQEGYLFLLDLWGEAERLSQQGAILPCCCDEPCAWNYDLTFGIPLNVEIVRGHYAAGQGVVGDATGGWGSWSHIIIRLEELCLPDYVTVEGTKSSDITHDFWYATGVLDADNQPVWQNGFTAWQGSSGAGAWSHGINVIPGVTEPFNVIGLYTQDNTEVRLTRVEAVP